MATYPDAQGGRCWLCVGICLFANIIVLCGGIQNACCQNLGLPNAAATDVARFQAGIELAEKRMVQGDFLSAKDLLVAAIALLPRTYEKSSIASFRPRSLLADASYQLGQTDDSLSQIDTVIEKVFSRQDFFENLDAKITDANYRSAIESLVKILIRRKEILGDLNDENASLQTILSRLPTESTPAAARFAYGLASTIEYVRGKNGLAVQRFEELEQLDNQPFELTSHLRTFIGGIAIDAGNGRLAAHHLESAAQAAQQMKQPLAWITATERFGGAGILLKNAPDRRKALLDTVGSTFPLNDLNERGLLVTRWMATAEIHLMGADVDRAIADLTAAQRILRRRDIHAPRWGAISQLLMASAMWKSGHAPDDVAVWARVKEAMEFAGGAPTRTSLMTQLEWIRQQQTSPYQTSDRIVAVGTHAIGLFRMLENDSIWRRDPLSALALQHSRERMLAMEAIDMDLLGSSHDIPAEILARFADERKRLRFHDRLSQTALSAGPRSWLCRCASIRSPEKSKPWASSFFERRSFAVPSNANIKPRGIERDDVPGAVVAELSEASAASEASGPSAASELSEPSGDARLSFTCVNKKIIGALRFEGKTQVWRFQRANLVPLIKALWMTLGAGNLDSETPATSGQPSSLDWKSIARKITRHCFPDDVLATLRKANRVVVAPDEELWQVPFEILTVDFEHDLIFADRLALAYDASPAGSRRQIAIPMKPNETPRMIGLDRSLLDTLEQDGTRPRLVFVLVDWPADLSLSNLNRATRCETAIRSLKQCGVESAIVSRWSVPGDAFENLMDAWNEELPFEGPEVAWRRAAMVVQQDEFAADAIPLLGLRLPKDAIIPGNHPYFWAGYGVMAN